MTDHQRPRDTVIIFDQGIGITATMSLFLRGKDVVSVQSIDEAMAAQKKHNCDTLFCSLLLSRSSDADRCHEVVSRLSQGFRNIGFYEPSLHGTEYLLELGLKNFHGGLDVNKFLHQLNVDFFLEHTSAHCVTQFGCNAVFDNRASWLVPSDFPRNSSPDPSFRKDEADILQFKRPVFEYGCFLYSSYDAKALDLNEDLYFIEQKVQNSAFHLSGVDVRQWLPLRDAGTPFYQTAEGGLQCPGSRDLARIVSRCEVDQAEPSMHQVEAAWLKNRAGAKMNMVVGRLDDCIITGTGAVLAKQRLVAESGYLQFPPDPIRRGMRRPHRVGRVEGWSILAINRPGHNYYHWLAQLLPLVHVAGRMLHEAGVREVTVVTAVTSRFHHDHLKLLLSDFDEVNVVSLRRHEYVAAEQGLFSNLAGEAGPGYLFDEHFQMATTLKQRLDISDEPATRLIYISRHDGTGRFVKNEADLIAAMKGRGFEILTMSEMSQRDQVRAFSHARIVIGPHGAGLTNILYSSEQTTLIELLQSTYPINCMMRLAQNVGARHIAQFFFPDDNSAAFPGPWCVDIERTCALVDRVLAESSG